MTHYSKSHAGGADLLMMPLRALDGLNSGIVKINRAGDITFANAKFCEIVGVSSVNGLNVRDILSDKDSAIVKERLRNRIEDLIAQRYRLSLIRRDDSSRAFIEIFAFPETDHAGTGIGSVAIVRDVTVEKSIELIHECLEIERDWERMFYSIAEAVKQVLPFDWCSISLYSADSKHVRQLISLADEPLPKWGVRWYAMPPVVLRLIESRKPLVITNLEEFLAQPGWELVLEDQATQQFMQLGYKSCLWYPVHQEGKTVAAITLYKKNVGGFVDRHKLMMQALPLRRAVAMGLYLIQRQDMELRLQLIKKIANVSTDNQMMANARADIERIANFLVRSIKEHYQWSNVSLFGVNEEQRRFVLIDECYEDNEHSFGREYWQHINEGVLSYVFENRVSVRAGNVHADPALKGRFKKALKGCTKSELTIPIMMGDKVCAILNSEDTQENAYSEDEQRALEVVLSEVATVYRRIELQQLLSAILNSAGDAIIRTDGDGMILWVNPRATNLFGYSEDRLIGTSLGSYMADRSITKYFLRAESFRGKQVTISCGNGTTRDVLMSNATLPDDVGGRVYIASDMSFRQREEKLDYLETLYHEIATQSQVPLSLCFSWLRRLSRQSDAETKETLTKVLHQLEKTETTFDRLSLFERDGSTIPYNPVLLDIQYILSGILNEMPKWEAERIDVDILNDPVVIRVRGDLFQLSFCLKSALSYLVKFMAPEGRISVEAVIVDSSVHIVLRGAAPEIPSKSLGAYADEKWSSHALFELELGREILQQFLAKHKGSFEGPVRIDKDVVFRLTVPAVAGDAMQ